MKFKCPRCFKITEFSPEDIRKIFLTCPACERKFRPSECSPVIGDKNTEEKIDRELRRTSASSRRR